MADELTQNSINIGDVHLLNLDQNNGITPKSGDTTRNKFFIVLGFDNEGNVIGGLVINSKINYKLPPSVTDYQLPVSVEQFPFLEHNSFINCSKIIVAKRSKFNKTTYRGEISDTEMMELIINTIKESPTVNKMQLKEFGIV
ncbi:MAG: hypothetical protein SO408_01225 [Sodaliphilus sp.]|nr:hypothetical protein [Bacteroidales bacterium]MDY2710138.1 hypothetical protein [Sodaliphilus sp.]MDD7228749.1 hypothetical protein [Bacteroidales bacterium]MDY4687097.1 hypothetical protein [Sodaliphilus sp.]MDY5379708.1 hypothetical protein [Sodaliphilus sp.]